MKRAGKTDERKTRPEASTAHNCPRRSAGWCTHACPYNSRGTVGTVAKHAGTSHWATGGALHRKLE